MRTALACAALILCSAPAAAQGRFHTGIVSWTPTIALRDTGLDTNVFDEAQDPKRDTVAIVAPRVESLIDSGTWSLAAAGHADFVYFRRYTNERHVNRGATARFDVRLSRLQPFARVGFLDTRERQNSEIDLRARRSGHDLQGGVAVEGLSRTRVEFSIQRSELTFREGQMFRGQNLAERLNRTGTTMTGRMIFQLSPLTSFTLDGGLTQDRFHHRPDQDTDTVAVNSGLEFAPDAIIRGRATLGYQKMTPRGTTAFGYSGVVAGVDLSFVLLQRTRFDVKAGRDTAFSLAQQPYYLRTAIGGEITHNLLGPLDLIARLTHERLDYPEIVERVVQSNLDRYNRYGGAIAYRPSDRLGLSLNYEFAERIAGNSPDFSFTRRRLFTVINYGF